MTQSAQKLHIAQPALTQSIHRLEKELGVPLFLPKGRNIVLTEYGKYLQEKLTPIIAVLEGIPEQLRTMDNLENETIHLNVLAASSLVTEAIIEYKKNNPNVNFKVLQNDESKLYDVQVGTRFLVAEECQVHPNYKKKILAARDIDTVVTGKSTSWPPRSPMRADWASSPR